MRTFFQMGFRNGFHSLNANMYGRNLFVRLGQDDTGWEPTTMPSEAQISPAPVVPTPAPTVTPPAASSGGTDWAKLIAQGITAAGAGYSAYSKEQVAKLTAQAQKGKTPTTGPMMAPSSQGAISPNTIFLVGGLAVTALIAVVALK